ncbi:MAG TPA: hypothetical protein PL148_08190 [Candidatus Aminicenantes bacterium]|nr:hypothetical protein [Candidatus Aminicenantes bacterium]HQI24120.1 hypothetical protein [Smithella sp.]
MNEYLISAKTFLNRCAPLICDSITNPQVLDALIFYAFGMERIFKGILWDINHTFVLEDATFKNAAVVLYSSKLLSGLASNKEFSPDPNNRIINYRVSLSRVKGFSLSADKHSNALFALSTHRDIIAHRPLSEINYESSRKLLLESFLPIMKDFSAELQVSLPELVGNTIPGLEFLSDKYRGASAERLKRKIIFYKQEWDRIKDDPAHQKRIETLRGKNSRYGSSDKMECPACGNMADLSLDVDCDYSDGIASVVGVFPVALYCNYCGLSLNDWDELDLLDINKRFHESLQSDDLES